MIEGTLAPMSSHGHCCPSSPRPTFPPLNLSFILHYAPNPGYIDTELLSIDVSGLNHVSPGLQVWRIALLLIYREYHLQVSS